MACGVYYWLYVKVIPSFRGYALRQEVVTFENGDQTNKFAKVPKADLAHWDATHDASGRPNSGDRDSLTNKSASAGSQSYGDAEKNAGVEVVGQIRST